MRNEHGAFVAIAATGAVALAAACSSPPGGSAASPMGAPTTSVDAAHAFPLPGRLFFTHTTSGDVQTALVADANGRRALTAPGDVCCVLRKSPVDDRLLVLPSTDFTAPLTGATMPTAGGPLTPMPRTDATLSLVPSAWSPDGTRIAFEGWDEQDPSRTGIYTARSTDGGDLVRVTETPGTFHDVPLDYSPDGTRLVYYKSTHPDPDPYTDGSLWVVGVDGSDPHVITTDTTPPTAWARWSPDGERILFAAERLSESGPLWTVAPDGTGVTTVFQDEDRQFAIAPDWSPDGTQIVFALDPGNDEFEHPPNRVFVISASGGDLRLVNDSPDFKRALEWAD